MECDVSIAYACFVLRLLVLMYHCVFVLACIGKAMAILEAKTFAASVLQSFRIKMRPNFEVRYRLAPVLSSSNGLPVTVELRK